MNAKQESYFAPIPYHLENSNKGHEIKQELSI